MVEKKKKVQLTVSHLPKTPFLFYKHAYALFAQLLFFCGFMDFVENLEEVLERGYENNMLLLFLLCSLFTRYKVEAMRMAFEMRKGIFNSFLLQNKVGVIAAKEQLWPAIFI